MPDELLYQIALTLIPGIGPVQARLLLQHYDVKEIFRAKKSDLERIEGIGTVKAGQIRSFRNFDRAQQEADFIKEKGISTLFITNTDYPKRLLNCYDPPVLLYYKGTADLDHSRTVAIVGTRNNTDYGRKTTEKIIEALQQHGILIISGLAFGIDSIAHKTALLNNIPTVGVVAHGLDMIYPSHNTDLAYDMINHNGGLLTQFMSNTNPDRHNFPVRNRIVAGLADATIIIETHTRGGSMITAEMACDYNRDLFAVPGRIADHNSSGCNYLIQTNKAILFTETSAFLETMGWTELSLPGRKQQKEIFIELSAQEKIIAGILKEKETISIDEINLKSGLSTSEVAAALLTLELQHVIKVLPGKMYSLK